MRKTYTVRWVDTDGSVHMKCFDRKPPSESYAHKVRRQINCPVRIETRNDRYHLIKAKYING